VCSGDDGRGCSSHRFVAFCFHIALLQEHFSQLSFALAERQRLLRAVHPQLAALTAPLADALDAAFEPGLVGLPRAAGQPVPRAGQSMTICALERVASRLLRIHDLRTLAAKDKGLTRCWV